MPLVARELRLAELPFTRSEAGNGSVNNTYTASLLNFSSLMTRATGSQAEDNWVGPLPIAVARPLEASTAHTIGFVQALDVTPSIDWIFAADNSAAATTRRFALWEYNSNTQQFSFIGSTLVTPPGAGNVTIRGFRAYRYLYSTGTVAGAAAGTAIAGAGTSWTTDRIALGARIGFGSTDPATITTWHEVTAIPSNVQITVTPALPSAVPSGTAYVIDELRLAFTTTNATAASGGLFVVKGLNRDFFTLAGTAVAAATTVDNTRSCYYLSPTANTAVNYETASAGIGSDNFISWQSHSVFHLNGGATANARITQYNMRSGLTLTAGRDPGSSVVVSTNNQAVPAGTITQTNNGRVALLAHGPSSGSRSFFFVTNNRIVRVPLANITLGNSAFIADSMIEVPPGGTTTFAAGGVFTAVEHSSLLDRLFITSTGAAGARSYVTQYRTDSGQMDHIFLVDTKQQDQTTVGAGAPPYPNINATAMSVWSESGKTYFVRLGTTAAINQMYMVATGVDYSYADGTGQSIITPAISTPGAVRFRSVYVNHLRQLGSDTLGFSPEPFKTFVRTSGINDNTGTWTEVTDVGDLGFLAGASQIQFRFTFRIFKATTIPARLHSVVVTYDTDDNILPELEWNLNDSNLNDGTVGFSQNAAFSGSVPNFLVEYYRSDTNTLVLSQNSLGTTNGTFQWFSASVWTGSLAPNGLGPNTVGTRRRFVPTIGLPANVSVYAQIKVV